MPCRAVPSLCPAHSHTSSKSITIICEQLTLAHSYIEKTTGPSSSSYQAPPPAALLTSAASSSVRLLWHFFALPHRCWHGTLTQCTKSGPSLQDDASRCPTASSTRRTPKPHVASDLSVYAYDYGYGCRSHSRRQNCYWWYGPDYEGEENDEDAESMQVESWEVTLGRLADMEVGVR